MTALAIAFGLVCLVLAGVTFYLWRRVAGAEVARVVAEGHVAAAETTRAAIEAQLLNERAYWKNENERLEAVVEQRGAEIARLQRRLGASLDPDGVRARLDGLLSEGDGPTGDAAGAADGPVPLPARRPAGT